MRREKDRSLCLSGNNKTFIARSQEYYVWRALQYGSHFQAQIKPTAPFGEKGDLTSL
jgi:hypothetical protein